MYLCARVSVCVYIYKYISIHVCIHAYICMHIYEYMFEHMHVRMFAFYVHIHNLYACTNVCLAHLSVTSGEVSVRPICPGPASPVVRDPGRVGCWFPTLISSRSRPTVCFSLQKRSTIAEISERAAVN